MGLLIPLIAALSSSIGGLVSDQNKAKLGPILDQHQAEIGKLITDSEAKVAEAQAAVLTVGIKSGGLEGSWRPILMYLIMLLIFINYGIGTLVSFFHPFRPIEMPSQLWDLILIAVPGYIGLRTHEKGGLPGSELLSKITNKIIK